VTGEVHYPAKVGLRVACIRKARKSPQWARLAGREGLVTANRRGEILVELAGTAGAAYWFLPDELEKT
jgi:hypothetical protein